MPRRSCAVRPGSVITSSVERARRRRCPLGSQSREVVVEPRHGAVLSPA